MEDQKLQIIQELMEQLQELMSPSEEDFGERLGKPKVEVVKLESEGDPMAMEGDMGGDEMDMEAEGMMDPDEKLKSRIMKLRG